MKWKQALANFGLTEETISIGLRNKIKDHYSIQEGIDELRATIANPSINDDVDELQDDLNDLLEAIEVSDDKLVRAIEVFDKNKDKYAEMAKKLGKDKRRERRKNKRANLKDLISEGNVKFSSIYYLHYS